MSFSLPFYDVWNIDETQMVPPCTAGTDYMGEPTTGVRGLCKANGALSNFDSDINITAPGVFRTASTNAALNAFNYIQYVFSTAIDLTNSGANTKIIIPNWQATDSGGPAGVFEVVLGVRDSNMVFADQTSATLLAGNSGSLAFPFTGFGATIDLTDIIELFVTVRNKNVANSRLLLSGGVGADPHVLAMDGTRLDVYAEGFYRFYDNCAQDPSKRLVVNIDVRKDAKDRDFTHAVFVSNAATGRTQRFTFEGPVFRSAVQGRKRLEHTEVDPETGASMHFVLEGKYNTVGVRAERMPSRLLCGGLMAGRVQQLDGVDSLQPTSKENQRTIEAATDRVHALVCGSNSPHAVTFSGASAETTADGVVTLMRTDAAVFAAHFEGGRIQSLNAIDASENVVFSAKWADVQYQERSSVFVSGGALIGDADRWERGACGIAEAWVDDVFIRVQPGGVASFATSTTTVDNSTGLLTTGDGVVGAVSKSDDAGSLYASMMEPHLLPAL